SSGPGPDARVKPLALGQDCRRRECAMLEISVLGWPYRGQPCLVQYPLRHLLIDVMYYEIPKSKCDLLVLASAVLGSILRKEALLHNVLKQHGVGTIGEAK